jgi:predicted ester cyclase
MKNLILLIAISCLVIFIISCKQQKDYSAELKPLVDKYVEVWNTGNVDELDAIMEENFVRNAEATPAEGLDKIKMLITGSRTSFPDLYLVLTDFIFSENRFAARFSFTATNTGPGQFPPTGKPVEVWGVVIGHFENGMLTEEWVGYDNQSLMEQLGFTMIPPTQEITN